MIFSFSQHALSRFHIKDCHDIICGTLQISYIKICKSKDAEKLLSLKRDIGEIKLQQKVDWLLRISLACILQIKQMKCFPILCHVYIQIVSYFRPIVSFQTQKPQPFQFFMTPFPPNSRFQHIILILTHVFNKNYRNLKLQNGNISMNCGKCNDVFL